MDPDPSQFASANTQCIRGALAALSSYSPDNEDLQLEALVSVLQACLSVLQRQLSNFLSEEEPAPSAVESVKSAPTHMASERALGCLDKMWRTAPVATAGFLSGKVRSKLNKQTDWLDSKTSEEREQLVLFAISEGGDERVKQSVLEKTVSSEISRRRKEISL